MAQIRVVGWGGIHDRGKCPWVLAASSRERVFNVMNIRCVQSEKHRCLCEKKSFPCERCGCWEEPAAPTVLQRHSQGGRRQSRTSGTAFQNSSGVRFDCHSPDCR
ncbi:hypothetical protein Q8A73_007166 [Channa argus]|nr:hypothetical protein Q8A73_007166 [Channa argus]